MPEAAGWTKEVTGEVLIHGLKAAEDFEKEEGKRPKRPQSMGDDGDAKRPQSMGNDSDAVPVDDDGDSKRDSDGKSDRPEKPEGEDKPEKPEGEAQTNADRVSSHEEMLLDVEARLDFPPSLAQTDADNVDEQ